MKIISWNVNGLRAVHKKGALQEFLLQHSPDVLCLQETKSKPEQVAFLDDELPEYEKFYVSAEKAGYSGTAIWTKKSAISSPVFISGMENFYNDTEGRIARVDIGTLTVIGVYFPNGGKSEEAWEEKLVFYKQFLEYIQSIERLGQNVIFCGDVNCCHTAIDIARPKENDGKIGFHPREREIVSSWILAGWKDIWRDTNSETVDQYSWWSYRGGARDRNVGWRIDYFFAHLYSMYCVLN